MSFTYSRALGEAFLRANSSATGASVLSSESLTQEPCLLPGKTTESSHRSQSGTMCALFEESRGAELLTSWLAGFRVKTLVSQAKAMDSMESAPGSGRKWLGLLARYDRDSSSWRTPQLLLDGGSAAFSATWPRWGSMRNGECWERETWAPPTNGTEYGSWPTPTATDFKSESMSLRLVARRQQESNRGVRLTEFLHRKTLPTPTAGNDHSGGRLDEWGGSTNPFRGTEVGRLRLNPSWVEELMGWPIGSTACEPLATARCQSVQQWHGHFSEALERFRNEQ